VVVQRKATAAEMIALHFADGARDPVNVEGSVRQAVMDNATSATVDLFDAAQKQVSQTISRALGTLFTSSDCTFCDRVCVMFRAICYLFFYTRILFTYVVVSSLSGVSLFCSVY